MFAGVGERTREGNDLYHEMHGVEAVRRQHGPLEDRAGLRPDERAAGRPRPRRALGAHGRRVLPRRREAGRAAVRRQHLPLHAGGLRGVGAPRPHPERRRLPADAVDRDGRAPGAHHLDEEGLDHLGAGDLRARRRPHRPGAGDGVRPPRRDDRAQRARSPRWASTRPSIRSTRRRRSCRPPSSASEHYKVAREVQRILQRYKDLRTSSRSSAWTSCREDDKLTVSRARKIEKFLVAAVPRRRDVHRPRRASTVARGHGPQLRGDPRRQVRRPARAGVRHAAAIDDVRAKAAELAKKERLAPPSYTACTW